jgi:TRAP-type C4-dicarboxylate transport system permease small subunit
MRRREHISVDLLLSGISKRKYSFLELFILIVSLLWCIVMGWQAWAVVVNAFKYGITSSSLLRFPLYISYSFLSIGLTLLTLQILAQIRRTLSGIMNASSSPA